MNLTALFRVLVVGDLALGLLGGVVDFAGPPFH